MKSLDLLALILLVVGGINWGLVAFFNFDLVAALTGAGGFGNKNALGVAVYALVAISALYTLLTLRRRVEA
jgi:uncharacterized membrane protein YuzA (DUF378 family)